MNSNITEGLHRYLSATQFSMMTYHGEVAKCPGDDEPCFHLPLEDVVVNATGDTSTDARMLAAKVACEALGEAMEGHITLDSGPMAGITGHLAFTIQDGKLGIVFSATPDALDGFTPIIQN